MKNMKSKISKILGVGLMVAMLASMLVVGTPASAAAQGWGSETTALATGDMYGNILLSGSSILDLALAGNGSTMYAATGSVGARLFKSLNNGAAWTSVTIPADAASIRKVALAPDVTDGSVLAILADDNEVYYSLDSCVTWYDLAVPTTTTADTLNCIAFSRTVGVTKTLAVGGLNTSNGAGLWYMDFGVLPAPWVDATTSATWDVTNFGGGGASDNQAVFALAFSPINFAGDRALAVVTGPALATSGNLNALLQVANFFTKNWNGDITGYTAWGTGLTIDTVTSGNVTQAASLALDPNFLGQVDSSRLVYVGLATGDTATPGGVYRFTNTTKAVLLATTKIQSVALNAAGDKLVAGRYDTNCVYRVASPATALSTGVLSNGFLKSPTGQAATTNVVVTWMGTTVAAGTSGTESAFSISTDDGKSFNDISLVNTTLAPKDFAVSADGTLIYLVSTSGSYTGLWKKGTSGTWARVLVLYSSVDILVRAAPENFDVAYLAMRTTPFSIYYTNDGGNTTWLPRYFAQTASYGITDMAVESASIIYVLSGTTVSKSIDSGLIWNGGLTATTIKAGFTGYQLTLVSAGNLLVGSASGTSTLVGQVAYSTDGNVSWTALACSATYAIPAGNVVATADKLSSGGWIYAASKAATSNVYRWNVGVSTYWFAMKYAALGAGAPGYFNGIAVSQGVLYVNGSSSYNAMYRTLSPTTVGLPVASSAISAINEWSEVSYVYTSPALTDTPQALWVNPVGRLWGITTSALYSFTDSLATSAPTLVAPATGSEQPMNIALGKAQDINFQIKAPTYYPYIRFYEMQMALDSTFATPLFDVTFPEDQTFASVKNILIGPSGTLISGLAYYYYMEFLPDTTYYWRVRTAPTPLWGAWVGGTWTPSTAPKAGTVDSPWSAVFSFKMGGIAVASISSPARGAYDVPITPTFVWSEAKGAVLYELEVSTDSTFSETPVLSVSPDKAYYQTAEADALDYNTTYYWRVRVPGGTWLYGVFTTMAEPTTPAPPYTIAPTETSIQVIEVPTTPAIPTYLLWIIVAIGAVLVIALLVLIIRTRRAA
jgi:hypothetical protein